ncbi:hypothetical protein L1887_32148 [Cichorium endivia]|nr:hypothetical protein L1887_32148 [Cichorium endivia]
MGFEYQHQQDHATHGAEFVDGSIKFYDTSGIKKGRFTIKNENNKFVKSKRGSKVRTVEDDEENDGERREAENDNHGEKDFGKAHETENVEDRQQQNENHDDREIKKWSDYVDTPEVPVFKAKNIDGGLEFVQVDENGDEMGKMLGYDMESNKQKVEKMLGRSDAFKVVQ